MNRESEHSVLIQKAIAEHEAWSEGRHDSNIDSFLENLDYPACVKAELREHLEREQRLKDVIVDSRSPGIPLDAILHARHASTQPPTNLTDPLADTETRHIGRYKLLQRIGRHDRGGKQ